MKGKDDLIAKVREKCNITGASVCISYTLDVLADMIMSGESVQLRGLGTFKVVDIPTREVRNPKTGEKITAAAHRKVKFIAGSDIKAALGKPTE